ncbi:pre-peptidase C-terminal domain-containing protein [Phormidium tenue FACHB-886]|nr:pre-peptidase C-terminal domain-containing protein [Phormidium tenue FACHB-886]
MMRFQFLAPLALGVACALGSIAPPALAQELPIAINSTVAGNLEAGDVQLSRDNSYLDSYTFEGETGQRIVITLTSQAFDPYLILLDAEGNSLSQNDDGGSNSNAQIVYSLPTDGKYTIYVNSYGSGGGAYSLSLQTTAPEAAAAASAQAANLPRYFCDEAGSVPQTMARRKDGLVEWLIQWTPDTAIPNFSTTDRCRLVSANLEQIHRVLGRDFQITTSRVANRNVVCAANVMLSEGQIEYQRGECAPQGLILTAADGRGAIAAAEALNARINLLNSAPPPFVPYTPPPDGQPIAVPYQFTFSTALAYSNCLEDIIQLYQNPNRLKEQGRRGDCVADIFSQYADGISKSQALELIAAANSHATDQRSYPLIYPPRGQRLRIQQIFGFTYTVDQ